MPCSDGETDHRRQRRGAVVWRHMHPYVRERFSDAEADVLRRYFTSMDGPVFALVNLPEVVKGALFARYSRSAKSLRRLFLDEFVGDLDISGDLTVDATVGLRRAEELYDRVFLEYGDDSVAQLGGVHLACEQLLLRMRAHPLPEARAYADLMLTELRKVIPSFLKRVDLDDRGVAWSTYLATNRAAMEDIAAELFPADQSTDAAPVVQLVD